MNIADNHNKEKAISTFSLFKGSEGTTTTIQILRNQELKEHITKVPALLICVEGSVNYADENEADVELLSGDYIFIQPNLKHWLNAGQTSNLLLIK